MILSKKELFFWRLGLGIGTFLSVFAIIDLVRVLSHVGISIMLSNWTLVLLAISLTLIAVISLFLATWIPNGKRLISKINLSLVQNTRWHWLGRLVFFMVLPIYTVITTISPVRWVLLSDPSKSYFVAGWMNGKHIFVDAISGMKVVGSISTNIPNIWLHLWLFFIMAVVAAWIIKIVSTSLSFDKALILAILGQTLVYKLALYIPEITSFPFSLGWSEASRYYYASLFFSQKLYGQSVPLSMYHPTRYLLLSLPFGANINSLIFHRFWQVFLWLGLTGLSSFLLTRRMQLKNHWIFLIAALWAFFYYLQGAVYYHLQVMVIFILAGFSLDKPGRTFFVVLLASFWAGISRVNWFPVPAMLAGLLYFLEKPLSTSNTWWKYLIWPITWFFAGIGMAVFSQGLYIIYSGNEDISGFGSSFTSDLLWYRLLPSPSFPMGVILSILLVILPGLMLLFLEYRKRTRVIHPLRWLGIVGYGLVLFGGGLVVSTKIGGGGDLHNMDAFIVFFLVLLTYTIFGQIRTESGKWELRTVPWPVLLLGLIIPLSFVFFRTTTIEIRDFQSAQDNLEDIQIATTEAAKQGDVLFITQRHLQSFGYVDVPFIPEYELLTLMEMSISGNQAYLDEFYSDLRTHRFSMILADKQFVNFKDKSSSFPEENNAWVHNVSIPLLCYYEPLLTYSNLNIQVFVPSQKGICP